MLYRRGRALHITHITHGQGPSCCALEPAYHTDFYLHPESSPPESAQSYSSHSCDPFNPTFFLFVLLLSVIIGFLNTFILFVSYSSNKSASHHEVYRNMRGCLMLRAYQSYHPVFLCLAADPAEALTYHLANRCGACSFTLPTLFAPSQTFLPTKNSPIFARPLTFTEFPLSPHQLTSSSLSTTNHRNHSRRTSSNQHRRVSQIAFTEKCLVPCEKKLRHQSVVT